jgi:Omp85 superfamily domain
LPNLFFTNEIEVDMKSFVSLFALCFFLLATLQAQEPSKKEKKAKKDDTPRKGSVYFTPLPVLSSNPSFGFMYGVASSTSWYMGAPSTTNISSLFAGITLTTKGQTLITAKATAFSENNDYKLDLDWRFLNSSQGTFGLGSGPASSKLASNGFEYNNMGAFSSPINEVQMLEFNWIRMHQTVTKKIANGTYIGLGYHLDILNKVKDNLLNLTTTPPVITSYYAYNTKNGFANEKSTLSGISFNGIYDTRDNINSTYKGKYAQVTFRVNPSFLGSDKNSTSLWTEFRDYFDLTKDHKNMLAFWAYGNFQTSGSLPYMNLPGIGYDQYSSSGRGYTQGRIRGQSLLYTELEYRKKLFGNAKNPDKWGMALFGNITTASSRDANIKLFEYLDPAIGLGIRFMVNPKSRTTLCLDYSVGKYTSSGIYLGLNEFF